MFPWQSNSSTRDNEQTNAPEEGPETPAHLFPVRAFKHALFGTPAPAKTDRKGIRQRPQSSYDRPRSRDDDGRSSSPGKGGGILRTPGTGGQKRKSVSFGGAGATSYEAAIGVRLGDYAPAEHAEAIWEEPDKPRSVASKASDFARRLRGESVPSVQEDTTLDMDAPRSKSGRYWKGEFDNYSTNTERQIKKLAKKEQVAKKFAQLKDGSASQLKDDLKRERARADDLEQEIEAFKRQLEYALKTTNHHEIMKEKDKELERLRKENEQLRTQLRAQWHAETEAKMSPNHTRPRSPQRPPVIRATTEPAGPTPPPDRDYVQQPRRRPEDSQEGQALGKVESAKDQHKDPSDIWADAGGSAADVPATASRQTPRRRPQDREPLAQRTQNVDSRSSSAAATLGTKPFAAGIGEQRRAVSNTSSTAGTLGSKRQSLETDGEELGTDNDTERKKRTNDDRKRKEMSFERQAAARKRLEERKKAKERVAG